MKNRLTTVITGIDYNPVTCLFESLLSCNFSSPEHELAKQPRVCRSCILHGSQVFFGY